MSEDLNMRDLEGQVIAGKYRLIKYLSEGGFGAVYRASHIAYELELREVAVKVAKRPMGDPEARDVFRDALVMARLADRAPDLLLRQSFVAVYDAGSCPAGSPLAGHPYVVMEYISTGSLRACIRNTAMPLQRAMRYFEQILTALAFMHEGLPTASGGRTPLLHRDIKPDNVLIARGPGGQDLAKLSDFGLAINVDQILGWAPSAGDLAYMAPEALDGEQCSPRTDAYMAALVLYEMLTGHSPFADVGSHLLGEERKNHRELHRLHQEARRCERFGLLDRCDELRGRPALGRLIRAVLAADPAARPCSSAGEFLTAWESAKRDSFAPPPRQPREIVRGLAAEAEKCFAALEVSRGDELLNQAMVLNRDPTRVPDRLLVGAAWLLQVDRMLRLGRPADACALALEGYRRRRCRSTCLAVSRCYSATGSPLGQRFEAEAQQCPDQE